MSNHSFTFAPGAPTGARSSSALCAAVAAVAILSGTVVMLQLSGPPSAGATPVADGPVAPVAPTAKTWDLEPRWWSGNVQRVEQPAVPSTAPTRIAVAESDLTFAKGYQL